MNKRKRKKRFKRQIKNSFIGIDLGKNNDVTHIITDQEIYRYLSIHEKAIKFIKEREKETDNQYISFLKANNIH